MLKANSTATVSGSKSGERSLPPSVLSSPIVMDEEDSQQDKLLKVLDAILEFLYPERCHKATVALRAFAFVWFLRPEWLGNPTQVELAKLLRVSKQTIGKVINQLRDKFGFYVAGMRHEDARSKFATNAKRHANQLATARKIAFHKKTKGTV